MGQLADVLDILISRQHICSILFWLSFKLGIFILIKEDLNLISIFLNLDYIIGNSVTEETYCKDRCRQNCSKQIKSCLYIKKFRTTSESTISIQIYVAVCAYLLVTIVRNDIKQVRSTCEVLQIVNISLIVKTHLKVIFDKTKFQYSDDCFGLNELN